MARAPLPPPPPGVTVRPLTPGSDFGIRVSGLDCGRCDDAARRWCAAVLYRHRAVVFGGQHRLSRDLDGLGGFSRFATAFGAPYPFYKPASSFVPGHPEITSLQNIVGAGVVTWDPAVERISFDLSKLRPPPERVFPSNINSFHTDMSFDAEPSSATLLLPLLAPAIEGPGNGTDLVDLKGAFDALPAEQKHFLSGLQAVHKYWGEPSFNKWVADHYGDNQPGEMSQAMDDGSPPFDAWLDDPEAKAKEGEDPWEKWSAEMEARRTKHPLVRPHPVTGEPTLFAIFATCAEIEGWSSERSIRLLKDLARHCLGSRFRYHHTQRPGELLLYDNWQTAHRGSPQMCASAQFSHIRCLYRITCKGSPSRLDAKL